MEGERASQSLPEPAERLYECRQKVGFHEESKSRLVT